VRSPTRVLVIGLDSADPGLIKKWCDAGDLPVLGSLRDRSRWGVLTSPPGLADDGVWASFSTSVSPGRHGRYSTKSLSAGSYGNPKFRDEDLKHETFWSALGQSGHRLVIIDVPKTPLARNFDGIQIRDWIVHGRDGSIDSWPEEIAGQLEERFGRDTTDDPATADFLCKMTQLDELNGIALVKELLKTLEQKTQVAMELLERGNWDLFLTVFKECHCATHQFWHVLDDTHPAYDAALSRRLSNPIKKIYQAIDTAIGRLLELAGPDAHVIVFSDLGMAANYTGGYILDRILRRLELAGNTWYQNASITLARAAHRAAASLSLGRYELTPQRFRRAFQVNHNELSGAIRINLKGREPHGQIPPGRELEEFCAALTRDLLDLENPATGDAVVHEVLRTIDLFDGNHLDALPDLFVVWNRDAPIYCARSKKLGEIEFQHPALRTGNHIQNGVYFLCGPHIEAGEQLEAVSIMDIGPTIATILGSPLSRVDGKSIAAD